MDVRNGLMEDNIDGMWMGGGCGEIDGGGQAVSGEWMDQRRRGIDCCG